MSPACDHCYARELAKRFGWDVWGKDKPRRFFGDKHWQQPLSWNAAAEEVGTRYRVFCGSMMDICEDRTDLDKYRIHLWQLIEATPYLDWLLLSKRPQKFRQFLPWSLPRPNVWLMTTIESPEYYWRWKELADTPAVVRGISYEPALAKISLYDLRPAVLPDWIIAGDESGRKARYSDQQWYYDLKDECRAFGVDFHMKQLCDGGKALPFDVFPEDLKIRQFPASTI